MWSGLNAASCIFDAKYKAAINSTRNLRTKVRVMRQESPKKETVAEANPWDTLVFKVRLKVGNVSPNFVKESVGVCVPF